MQGGEEGTNYLSALWELLWKLLGLTEINTLAAVISSIIGIVGIIIAIPSLIKFFKERRKNKASLKKQNIFSSTSPFTTGKAVTPPQFVGRVHELKLLDSCLANGESVSILGNRRIGKSSLLATWAKSLNHNGYKVVLLNGQGNEGRNLRAFLFAITQGDISNNITADSAANKLTEWAKEQKYQFNQKKPVILVDECEAIIKQCPHRFWERVRGALDHIIWVFSSKQPLDTLYKRSHNEGSPFENQLKTQWLGLLDQQAAEAIIKKGNFTQTQENLLREWAGCHPFYLQSLAGRLFLEKPKNKAEITHVLDNFKMDAKRHLNDLWQGLTPQQQEELLNFIKNKHPIDSSALRCMGVITTEGVPFARVFLNYLKAKRQDHLQDQAKTKNSKEKKAINNDA